MTRLLFLGGVPTEPDVKKLNEAFLEIEPDQGIPYSAVEQIIGAKRGTSRWMAVTNAWRKHLRSLRNIVLAADGRSRMFRRLPEGERSERNASEWVQKQKQAIRRVNDQQRVVTSVMTEGERNTHDHRTRVMVAHVEATREAAKQIAPPRAPRALPSSAVKEEASKEIEPPMPKGLRAVKEG